MPDQSDDLLATSKDTVTDDTVMLKDRLTSFDNPVTDIDYKCRYAISLMQTTVPGMSRDAAIYGLIVAGKAHLNLESFLSPDRQAYSMRQDRLDALRLAHRFVGRWSCHHEKIPEAAHPGIKRVRLKTRLEDDNFTTWRHFDSEVNGDLWIDVWAACDRAIRQAGDMGPLYIEGLDPDPDDSEMLVFGCGS